LGQRRGGRKKNMRARRMGFLFIGKTSSRGSSSTGELVAAGSLQPEPGVPENGKNRVCNWTGGSVNFFKVLNRNRWFFHWHQQMNVDERNR